MGKKNRRKKRDKEEDRKKARRRAQKRKEGGGKNNDKKNKRKNNKKSSRRIRTNDGRTILNDKKGRAISNPYKTEGAKGHYALMKDDAKQYNKLVSRGWQPNAPKGRGFDTKVIHVETKGKDGPGVGKRDLDQQSQITLYRPDRKNNNNNGNKNKGWKWDKGGKKERGGSSGEGQPVVEDYTSPEGGWVENSPFERPEYDYESGAYNGAQPPPGFSSRGSSSRTPSYGEIGPSSGSRDLDWLDNLGRPSIEDDTIGQFVVPGEYRRSDFDEDQESSFDRVLNFLGDYETLMA